jgi:hypothetical protein
MKNVTTTPELSHSTTAPYLAHGVLADRSPKQGGKCTAHTTRIGAGQIDACNQRIGSPRPDLLVVDGGTGLERSTPPATLYGVVLKNFHLTPTSPRSVVA